MNEPIISPWLFYWIDVLHSYDVVNTILFLCFSCGLLLMFITYFCIRFDDDCGNYQKMLNRARIRKLKIISKRFLAVYSIIVLGVLFIPSKETTYKMLVAQYVTPKNVEITTLNAERLIERIVELVVIKEKESEKK